MSSIQSVSEGAFAPSFQNFENWVALPSWLAISPQRKRFFEAETAVDGDELRGDPKAASSSDLRHDFRPQAWIARQEAEGDHGVGLAAAHRLLEFEDGLVGFAGQPLQALVQEGAPCLCVT